MTNNLYKPLQFALLLIGLLTFPFLSFSQQQEEPKRVTVVVTAKEVATPKEIIQLPADNLPKVVNSKSRLRTSHGIIATKTSVAPKSTPKENTAVKPSPVLTKTPAVAKAAITKSTTVENKKAAPIEKTALTKTKPIVRPQQAKEKPAEESSSATLAKAALRQNKPVLQKASAPEAKPKTEAADVKANNEPTQIANEAKSSVKAETTTNDVAQISHSTKVNSFSYIWIGIFLIVAGVVLGLLFGKPAFLISFVGIVFITLGLII